MNVASIVLWGFAATMTLTTILIAGQALGSSRRAGSGPRESETMRGCRPGSSG